MGHRTRYYGVTFIVAELLVMLPIEAVTVTCPPVVKPATAETTPAVTVARFVLLEAQFATEVTPTVPLQVAALAVRSTVEPELLLTEPPVGDFVIDVTHPTVTVTLCVPLMVGI